MFESKYTVICVLEEMIFRGTTIVIYDSWDENLLSLINNKIDGEKTHPIVLFHKIPNYSKLKMMRYISQDDIKLLLDFYKIYDFSDKVSVISESPQFGSLFNYVKTGILTPEEMVEALLYDI